MHGYGWRSRSSVAVALLLLLALIYLATIGTVLLTNDVVTSSVSAWRIAHTGTPWFDHLDYQHIAQRDDLWIGVAANGHTVGFRSPGSIAAAVPAYWIAHLLGVQTFSIVPASVTAALLTALAMTLLFLALDAHCRRPIAVGAVLTVALTTPVWSVSADSLWTHPVTLFGIAGMAYGASRERWWLVGLFGGVAVWGRLHTAVIVALVGLGVAWAQRRPRVALAVGTVALAFLALASLWSHWFYGTWNPAGGYSLSRYSSNAVGSGSTWYRELSNHLGLWVSPGRGLFVWTPVVLLLLPALARSWRTLPAWPRWLTIGGVAYALVQGQLNGFSGGSFFYPYRLMLETLVCAVPALAMSVGRAGPWARRLLGPAVGLQFAVISIGAASDGGIATEAHLWTDNAYWFAVRHAPVLAVWVAAMVALGWYAGVVVRRRWAQPRAEPSAAAPSG